MESTIKVPQLKFKVVLLMTLLCYHWIQIGRGDYRPCNELEQEFILFVESNNSTTVTWTEVIVYELNGNEVATVKVGQLQTAHKNQILRANQSDIGINIKSTGTLNVTGKWTVKIKTGDTTNSEIKYVDSEIVEIQRPKYYIANTEPITVWTREKEVYLPFEFKPSPDNNCTEYNVPFLTWTKTNDSGDLTLAVCDHDFSQFKNCTHPLVQEYIQRIVFDKKRDGCLTIKNPVPSDSGRYTLYVSFNDGINLTGFLELTVLGDRHVAEFEFRLAALIHTERKADSALASAIFTEALRSLSSSVANGSFNFIPLIRSGPCTAAMASRQIVDVWIKQYVEETLTVDAIRGFIVNDCDEACSIYGAFASFLKTPTVTYGCTSDVYITDPDYSTLIRTVPRISRQADSIYQLMNYFQWKRLAVLSTLTTKMESAGLAFVDYLSSKNFTIFRYRVDASTPTYRSSSVKIMEDAFKAAKVKYRIMLLLMESKAVVEFLSAVRSRTDSKTFVFLTINNQLENDHYFSKRRSEKILKLMEGVISASIRPRPQPKSKRQADSDSNSGYPWAGYLYDAAQILVTAWHEEFTKGPSIAFNNSNAVIYARGINSENGAVYGFQIVQSGLVVDISNYFLVGISPTPPIDFNQTSKIQWPNNVVPSDIPCSGSDCDDIDKAIEDSFSKSPGGIITYTCISVAICLLILFIIFMIWRQKRYNNAVQTLPDWIIPWMELEIREADLLSTMSTISTTAESLVLFNADGAMQTYTTNANYKGNVVAIRELNCTQIDVAKRENIMDVSEIRSLYHENLNQFIGVCVQSPHVAIVWLYAARGSIDDLLQSNSHFLHNFDLLASLLLDIARGMTYLHRSVIGSHGLLKSTNCVVDERWTCRVTDYGMGHIRNCGRSRLATDEMETDDRAYSDQLWTAPELLRMKYRPLYGTKKGDVYSFGIILQEVLLMDVPYSLNMEININLVPRDIVAKVRDVEKDVGPYRPILPIDCAFDVQWINLTKVCWHENPSERPTFSYIRDEIMRLANFEEMDLVDKTLLMLEEYHVNLQGLVQRRTEKLELERQKTEDLDLCLIPRGLVKVLEFGEVPAPATYESVTVYYSTVNQEMANIPGERTAHQMVLLVNTLYNSFDTITDKYALQKVDSIGGAYIVAGGLNPTRTRAHYYAWQTATLALHLLTAVRTLNIPDISNDYIKVKIGLHTGSVMSGVVGTKRLFYNIFGETVQIAEGLQAQDEAENQIIISAATEELLRTSGNFNLKSRGLSEVIKGKTMETFFLLDETGFVLKAKESTAAAYLPRSPYVATRDRGPNPFASGKPMSKAVSTDVIPETVASPPHIPDNPPPVIETAPIVEETPFFEDEEVEPSPVVSERRNLLEDQFNKYKKTKTRTSTKLHEPKPAKVVLEKPHERKPVRVAMEKPHEFKAVKVVLQTPDERKPDKVVLEKPGVRKPLEVVLEEPQERKPVKVALEKPEERKPAKVAMEKPHERKPFKVVLKKPPRDTLPSLKRSTLPLQEQRKESSPRRETSPKGQQNLNKRHTTVYDKGGFTYTFRGRVPPESGK